MLLPLKAAFQIRTDKGASWVNGYIAELYPLEWKDYAHDSHCIGFHKARKGWDITDLNSGRLVNSMPYKTRKEAVQAAESYWIEKLYRLYAQDSYAKMVDEFDRMKG